MHAHARTTPVIATLLPLVSFVILAVRRQADGQPLAGVGRHGLHRRAASSAACVAMIAWYTAGRDRHRAGASRRAPINPDRTSGSRSATASQQEHPGYLDVGIYVDSLTIAMFAMITLVATLVHVFSIGYMREDKRFPRFFTYLGLFCFSMLGLVLGGTMLQLFIFWELVGLCSYLLIGFWYEKKCASQRRHQGVRHQPRRRLRVPHRLRHSVLSPRQRDAAGHVDRRSATPAAAAADHARRTA